MTPEPSKFDAHDPEAATELERDFAAADLPEMVGCELDLPRLGLWAGLAGKHNEGFPTQSTRAARRLVLTAQLPFGHK